MSNSRLVRDWKQAGGGAEGRGGSHEDERESWESMSAGIAPETAPDPPPPDVAAFLPRGDGHGVGRGWDSSGSGRAAGPGRGRWSALRGGRVE